MNHECFTLSNLLSVMHLKGTFGKKNIFKQNNFLTLEVYIDAEYIGLSALIGPMHVHPT